MQYIILCLFLALPFAIVGLWKKRPVVAFIIAALLSYLMLVLPGIIRTFQAMMIYGSGDPQLIAGGDKPCFRKGGAADANHPTAAGLVSICLAPHQAREAENTGLKRFPISIKKRPNRKGSGVIDFNYV